MIINQLGQKFQLTQKKKPAGEGINPFMSFISFYTPENIRKPLFCRFLMFSGDAEKEQLHESG